MNKIKQPAQAGTLESNDVVVMVAPASDGIGIELSSIVIEQFGEQIKAVVAEVLKQQGITEALVKVNDRGALDCTIKARVLAALARSGASIREESTNGA